MDDLEVSAMTAAKCFKIEVCVMPEAMCVGRVQSSLSVVALHGSEGPDISDEVITLKSKPSKQQVEVLVP
jgi:hypothetical protein